MSGCGSKVWAALGLILVGGAGSPVVAKSPSEKAAAVPTISTAQQVDRLLRDELAASGSTETAKPLDDEAFVRRVYLDLVGEWPTAAELTAFVFNPAPDKRAALVDRLLADERFGLNWGRYWRDVVLYRRAEDRALLASGAAGKFFTDKLNAGASWSEIATEMITAQGNVVEQGATVLFFAQMGDANDIASEVSRIFTGIQISCAQCHDHPTDRWKRQQFHELAAFSPRVSVRPIRIDGQQRSFEVVGRDFGLKAPLAGQQANARLKPIEHYMPDLNDPASSGTLVQPVFFATGKQAKPDERDMPRRASLAAWLTSPENPWFAKAFVNRVWAELTGEGFYEPVDDLGPDRPCTAPQTMDYLAAAFADTGYDVKWLYRVITATTLYGSESRPLRNPEEAAFAANCIHRIRGDQIFDALTNALGMPQDDPLRSSGGYGRAQFATPRNQFNQAFGYDPSGKRDEVTGSIQQALVMMNSPTLASGINGRSSSTTLGKLLAAEKDDEAVAVELYLRCLAREPSDKELSVCLDYVKQTGNRTEAFEDVLWSLVNSTEFLHRQ